MRKLYHANLMLKYIKLIDPKVHHDIRIISEKIYLAVQERSKKFHTHRQTNKSESLFAKYIFFLTLTIATR